MELKVKKERVLAAAKKSKDAERILKEIFPEAFEEELFNSQCSNMDLSEAGTYRVKDYSSGYICFIKNGMLKLNTRIRVPGIKTDSNGRIKIHPDSLE